MGLRETLVARVQPLLEPGEQVQAVIPAQTGPSPGWVLLLNQLLVFVRRRLIVATDRAVVVVRAGVVLGLSAKEVRARLPRTTPLGPLSGLWDAVHLDGERLWVLRPFHRDVERADQATPAVHDALDQGTDMPPRRPQGLARRP